MNNRLICAFLNRYVALACVTVLTLGMASAYAEEATDVSFYDESAYTEYVEGIMAELDSLYVEFNAAHGEDAEAATLARKAVLVKAHKLMHSMNARYDKLDPKKGAALSPTETLVNIHALIMLVDILSETQLEHMAQHPFVE